MGLFKKKPGGTALGNLIRKEAPMITGAVGLALGIPPSITSGLFGAIDRPPLALAVASASVGVTATASAGIHNGVASASIGIGALGGCAMIGGMHELASFLLLVSIGLLIERLVSFVRVMA
jgi:hypothetical protein